MGKYGWSDFVEGDFFVKLSNFFEKLKEIGNTKKNTSFVFISVEAVCLFLLWRKKGFLNDWNFRTYSDRYVMKNLDPDFLTGETIVLVDDAMITGGHLKKIYHMLLNNSKADEIIPAVFLADQKKWQNDDFREQKEFKNMLLFELCTVNDILKFSSIENLLLYQEGIPYMVELPVLKMSGSSKPGIVVDDEQFNKIKKGNSLWEYHECPQVGYLQNDITSGVLIRKNHIFNSIFSEFLFSMSVRVQMIPKNGKYELVMVPFAILKSIEFKKLLQVFYTLFAETDYGNMIKEYEEKVTPEEFAEKVYILVYRSVVFHLSIYIGEELKRYIALLCDMDTELICQPDIISFDDIFMNSILPRGGEDEHHSYLMRLINLENFKKIPCRLKLKKLSDEYDIISGYSYKRAYNFVLEVINDVRHGMLGEKDGETEKRFISIEELEYLFIQIFNLTDDDNVEGKMTGCLNGLLNQGSLANEIYYEKNSGIVYRGFRYGVNSDAFYDVSAKVFIAAVLKYYQIIGDRYMEKYDLFKAWLFTFFKDSGLYKSLIDSDEFKFYAKYFQLAGESGFEDQIKNKAFLIADRVPVYIQMAEDFIAKLDFSESRD